MEYRINKIDTDLRIKINEATREGRIHSKEALFINKDQNKKEKNKDSEKNFKLIKYNEKKYIVEAEKTQEIEVQGINEDRDTLPTCGRYLDLRK